MPCAALDSNFGFGGMDANATVVDISRAAVAASRVKARFSIRFTPPGPVRCLAAGRTRICATAGTLQQRRPVTGPFLEKCARCRVSAGTYAYQRDGCGAWPASPKAEPDADGS
jgi:hypothetical protein